MCLRTIAYHHHTHTCKSRIGCSSSFLWYADINTILERSRLPCEQIQVKDGVCCALGFWVCFVCFLSLLFPPPFVFVPLVCVCVCGAWLTAVAAALSLSHVCSGGTPGVNSRQSTTPLKPGHRSIVLSKRVLRWSLMFAAKSDFLSCFCSQCLFCGNLPGFVFHIFQCVP